MQIKQVIKLSVILIALQALKIISIFLWSPFEHLWPFLSSTRQPCLSMHLWARWRITVTTRRSVHLSSLRIYTSCVILSCKSSRSVGGGGLWYTLDFRYPKQKYLWVLGPEILASTHQDRQQYDKVKKTTPSVDLSVGHHLVPTIGVWTVRPAMAWSSLGKSIGALLWVFSQFP